MNYPKNYWDKVYSGWLGKIIGIIYGTPTEGWKNKEITKVFSNFDNYLTDYKRYASDDDYIWGIIYQENLKRITKEKLNSANFANAIMNYVPNGHGVMWWGGKNVATEHTAFININEGILPPKSGSSETNLGYIANQIGGEIFNDHWGLICPNDVREAMLLARKMAEVTHDDDAVVGAMFMAGCVALSFDYSNDIKQVIEKVVDQLPNSHYKEMCIDILDYYKKNQNWNDNFKYISSKYFSTEKYPGVCHVIPNAAIVIIALLCCENNFDNVLKYTLMSGEDTDSNLGNAGMIIGVLLGLEGIHQRWIVPLNDEIICSTSSGEMNIQYISDVTSRTVELSKKYFLDEEPELKNIRTWNFEKEYATKGFKTAVSLDKNFTKKLNFCKVKESEKVLSSYFSFLTPNDKCQTYFNAFYLVKDFEDSRYDPEISPKIFFGQQVKCKLKLEEFTQEQPIEAYIFVESAFGKKFVGERISLTNSWSTLNYEIPKVKNDYVYKVGIEYHLLDEDNSLKSKVLRVDLKDFEISGKPFISIDLKNAKEEYWTRFHKNVLGFTSYRQNWEIVKGGIANKNPEGFNEVYFGQNFGEDFIFQTTLDTKELSSFGMSFFVEGIYEKIEVRFSDNKLFIIENYDYLNSEIIFEGECLIATGKNKIKISVHKQMINVFLNNKQFVKDLKYDCNIFKGNGQFSLFEKSKGNVTFEKVEVI